MSVIFDWSKSDFEELVKTCETSFDTKYILQYMPKDGTILEAGCGLGRYVQYLTLKGYEVTGLELNIKTCKRIKEIVPKLRIVQGDVLNLPFLDDSLSGIISLGVIEHFDNGPIAALNEMFRVLKKGYYAVISVPSYNFKRRVLYLFNKNYSHGIPYSTNIEFLSPDMYGTHKYFQYLFAKKEFEDLIRQVGFTVIKSVPDAKKSIRHPLSFLPFCSNHMHLCVAKK